MRTFFLISLVLACLGLTITGCTKTAATSGVPFHEQSLYNYYLGKHYMGQGRLELARQRFAMAKDTTTDTVFRARCTREISMVTAMIKTRRLGTHAY